jgi:predicted ribosomally synthesized peptide with nif11-like leader
MSMDQLAAFGRHCTLDPIARSRLALIHLENLDSLIAFANELGFAVSLADFQDLRSPSSSADELSDKQLARVSAGVGTAFAPYATAGDAMAALLRSLGVALP